jgi:hypothetical protein
MASQPLATTSWAMRSGVGSRPFPGVPRGPGSPLNALASNECNLTRPEALEATVAGLEGILPEGAAHGEDRGLGGPSPFFCGSALGLSDSPGQRSLLARAGCVAVWISLSFLTWV